MALTKDKRGYSAGKYAFELDNAVFAKLGAGTHALNKAFFRVGSQAVDANDHIIYNRKNGYLYYDSNGDAAGGQTLFAVLGHKPVLTAYDLLVI